MANLINTRLIIDTSLSANGIIPVGNVIHKSGCGLSAGGNTVTISGAGYYKVVANVTFSPTADGTVTTTLFSNGVEVATASQNGTATDPVNTTLVAVIYNKCGCNNVAISVGESLAGIVNEMDIVVERI